MLRAWLMRRRGVLGARAAPGIRTGPSRHGKDLIATHLNIMKARVRESLRQAGTGISCEPGQVNKAGSTHDFGSMNRHYHALLRRLGKPATPPTWVKRDRIPNAAPMSIQQGPHHD
jgi:hypothetical protein